MSDNKEQPDRSTELAVKLDASPGPRVGALGRGGMPVAFTDKIKLAGILYESGLIPTSYKSAKQVFVALQYGDELGLSPWVAVQNIVVINGRVSLTADMIVAFCQADPAYAGMTVVDEPHQTTVTMRRRNIDGTFDSISRSFGEAESVAAGLDKKETYVKWKRQMWTARAKSFCGRLAFPGRVSGLLSAEEAEDLPQPEEPRPVVATGSAVPTETVEEIRARIEELLASQYLEDKERTAYAASAKSIRSATNLAALRDQIQKLVDEREPADVGGGA